MKFAMKVIGGYWALYRKSDHEILMYGTENDGCKDKAIKALDTLNNRHREDDNMNDKKKDNDTPTEPPVGSWAHVAREMAQLFPDDDFDWDAWKDEMKDQDHED